MKIITQVLILMTFLTTHTVIGQETVDKDAYSSNLTGPYLGQKPPGLTPEPFAPNLFSKEYRNRSGFFTPDMKKFYFTRRNAINGKWSLMVFKYEKNKWHESLIGPRIGRPILAPDGQTMHLGKNYIERTETGWSEVKSLGPMFDREDWGIMRLSASNKGTYVFDDYKSNDVLRISTIKDGKREEPKLLNKDINTGKWTAHPFIAPDESYLIWDSEKESGYGDTDLYISFRQSDGSWGAAINMGDRINTRNGEAGGYVTPDGKYFFYNKSAIEGGSKLPDDGIYWVDAQIIETLRPIAEDVFNYPTLTGPYLGQKPPGSTPEVFAPGIVSTELYELFSAFTPDMKEFYFVRYDADDKPSMIFYKYEDDQWSKSITGPKVGEPFISPDGKTMHLGSRYMERTNTGWSDLKSLEAPFKDMRIMRLTASSKDTFFFDTAGEEPIRYSLLVNDERGEPKTLNIDLGKHNAHPWITPDESYLIWDDQRKEGYGGADLYISFRKQDGSWGPSINLGDKINSERSDSYPTITPDGKYLLFNRNINKDNVDIYWVDTSFIEILRPK